MKPAGIALPDEFTLMRCEYQNPHGFGFATPTQRYHTMNRLDFENHVYHDIKLADPAILHCRIATHGSIKKANCHPFFDKETGVSFAHNGILDITPKGDWTDSETAFRTIFVPVIKKYGLKSKQLEEAVCDIIGGSRFAFMDDKGHVRLFGHWLKMNGCYYSHYI